MKKNVYLIILTVVTVICVIVGSCYHLIGFGVSVLEQLSIFQTRESTEAGPNVSKNAVTIDDFTSIQANVNVMDLDIVRGDSYSVSYRGNEKLQPDYKVENGCLTIIQSAKLSRLMSGNKKCSLTVTVPVSLTSANIQTDVGDLAFSGQDISDLTITADVGDIDLNDCSLENAKLEANIGDIDFKNCSFTALDISSDVGDVDFASREDLSAYTIDLSTDVGDVEVNGKNCHRNFNQQGSPSYGKLTITNDTGDIELDYKK